MYELEFVYLASYERSAKGVIDRDDEADLERRLRLDPEVGDVMPATGGIRKLRLGIAQHGRRGGARLLYYYRSAAGRVYMILVYRKNRHDAPTSSDRAALRALVERLEGEG